MSEKKINIFKVVNIIIAILGVMMTIYINRYALQYIILGKFDDENIFEYIKGSLCLFVLLLCLFYKFKL